MGLGDLKGLRVAAAVVFTAAAAAVFLDPGGWAVTALARPLTSLQFVPALLKAVTVAGIWTAGAVFVLLLTLLFGRVYCSTLCPLGVLQDVVIRLRRRFGRRVRYRYERPPYAVHYGLLYVIVAAFLAGSVWLLDLVEPFSNFGRVLAVLARPPLAALVNGGSYLLGTAGIYALSPVQMHPLVWGAVAGALLFLALVSLLAWHRGRLFCNLLCPTGALLGLAARFSLFRIVIDEHTCLDCGLCERVCKASCIDSTAKRVDMAACVGCFNCLDACPTVGMAYTLSRRGKSGTPPAPVRRGRRRVLAAFAAPLLAGGLAGSDSAARVAAGGVSKRPVTPPGAGGERRFTSACTACHLCVSACPTRVLAPTFLEYGAAGVFQPRMDFHHSYCNYDCTACTAVCPTGALLPLTQDQKKEVQIGTSVFVKDDCIVVAKKTDCGACSEHCPTKAVQMVPYEKKLLIPELDNDLCVGCGACEHACPTKPRKAIYVEANVLHGRARRPAGTTAAPKTDVPEEFPF